MQALLSVVLSAALPCGAAPAFSEPRQVLQGTQIHLTLLHAIGTFTVQGRRSVCCHRFGVRAVGNQLLIPAGTRVNGMVGTVEKAPRFSVLRGQAYMSLKFRPMEIDSRLLPVQMTILMIEQPRTNGDLQRRKDVKVEEGQVIERKHDYKGDISIRTSILVWAGSSTSLPPKPRTTCENTAPARLPMAASRSPSGYGNTR